jgi:hypothetical protein
MKWFPVFTGNPGFGACPVLDTEIKPDNDNHIFYAERAIPAD